MEKSYAETPSRVRKMAEANEGWWERGRDGEPLIIYDSLSFFKAAAQQSHSLLSPDV